MSIARHHAEWLSLLDIVGSFLSMEVLLEVFPQGLSAHDSEHFALLKQVYAEWGNEQSDRRIDREIHRAWVEWVLVNTLGYPQEYLKTGQEIANNWRIRMEQHQETLAPDWVLVDSEVNKPELLIQIFEPSQKLDGTYKGINKGSNWSASPVTRMVELLRGLKVSLGLITNGEEWMLVYAPQGGTSSTVSWYGNIWVEEKITLRAFRDLLGVERFFGVQEQDTLASLCDRSKNSQQEVTDQLGLQVRKAVEILIQKLAEIDADHQGKMLAQVSMQELYRAACFVMMRLVFLLCAEERGLLLLGEERYDKNYAVSTLQESLRAIADHSGEEILERRHDAWCRLMALFRAVHGGVYHPNFKLPAYGGDLFDPDAFPFLEGRFEGHDEPIAVDNRTVLHLLESLQILRIKVAGGSFEPRRLSFKAIEVEQIGHVYEGLLDHQAVRSQSTVLGLEGTKNKEPEILLEYLEALAALGEEVLVKFLKKETGRGEVALKKLLPFDFAQGSAVASTSLSQRQNRTLSGVEGSGLSHYEESRYLTRCGNDLQLWHRIKPFYKLIRKDTREYPVIISTGSVYVTTGTDRRESGTHYTPKALTEEIVRYTLEPLVYVGVSEGLSQSEWRLRSPQEILNLKICDPTMGSGAFLVQVCRFLAARLLESWEGLEGSKIFTVFGNISKPDLDEALIPDDDLDRLIVAKRLIAERCVYGVDKNPLAVEMAKLSLWLETLQKDKPFTFVDHALRCGDSLLGLTSREQFEKLHLNPEKGNFTGRLVAPKMKPVLQKAIAERLGLKNLRDDDRALKEAKLREADRAIAQVRYIGDSLIGECFAKANKAENLKAEDLNRLLETVVLLEDEQERDREISLLKNQAERRLNFDLSQQDLAIDSNKRRVPFHWIFEFPEIFLDQESAGFDAICGNPPFMGGLKLFNSFGESYRDYLVEYLANGERGNRGTADFCSYFFLQVFKLLKNKGFSGLVATNTISQGDSRRIGLDQIYEQKGAIYRAIPSRPWSGTAALEVSYIWLAKESWEGNYFLDDKLVSGINPYLTVPNKAVGNPYKLEANSGRSFIGSYVLGMGFVLEPEEAKALITKDSRNKDVLFPFLNGSDVNSNYDQSPSRWVINFFDWALSPEQDDPKKLKGAPYASDYPDCLEIVERLVKPERQKLNQSVSTQKRRANNWWTYGQHAPALYEAISQYERVLVIPLVSKYFNCAWEPTNIVFSHAVGIIATDSNKDFALIQNTFHDYWAREQGSSLETRMRYTPSDCFETFPFPTLTPETEKELEAIGEKYYNQRSQIMQTSQLGLTKTYNRFHDPNDTAADIQQLRDRHIQMDYAVAKAYGWTDLGMSNEELVMSNEKNANYSSLITHYLNHGFHQTKQGLRFTISETARRDILDRLLALNHQRYAEEVKAGLWDKSKGKKKKEKVVQVSEGQTDFLDKINQS